jgi:hypothetical protein
VFFLLTLAPSSGLVPIATEVGAEPRMYLPLGALTALVAGGLYAWLVRGDAETAASRRRVWMGVVALACVSLGVGTMLRTREFASDITLAESDVHRWPQGRARVGLAAAYTAASRQTEALAQLRLAVSDYLPARVALARASAGRWQHRRGAVGRRGFHPGRAERPPGERGTRADGASLRPGRTAGFGG